MTQIIMITMIIMMIKAASSVLRSLPVLMARAKPPFCTFRWGNIQGCEWMTSVNVWIMSLNETNKFLFSQSKTFLVATGTFKFFVGGVTEQIFVIFRFSWPRLICVLNFVSFGAFSVGQISIQRDVRGILQYPMPSVLFWVWSRISMLIIIVIKNNNSKGWGPMKA